MRDYGKISPKFWTQGTGKALRGHPEAQIVAMYLMTCPLSEMTGVFYCPLWTIAGETGLGEEGASKGLARLVEMDFCTFEGESETMFVHEMAKYQIGEGLKPLDNQVKGIRKAYAAMQGLIKSRFYERYAKAFHLPEEEKMQAPCKPLRSQEQEQEQKQDQEQEQKVDAPPAERSAASRGSRLPEDWLLPKAWGEWALQEQPTWTVDHVRKVAEKFKDHWHGKAGKDGRKADWLATWRNWVRNEKPLAGAPVQDKFQVANLDHSSSRAAMEASMKRHNIQVPAGDDEITL